MTNSPTPYLEWYEKYRQSAYFAGYQALLNRLPQKVSQCGHLDIEDLCAIADWGGNQHGPKQKLLRQNQPEDVKTKTAEAVRYFAKPRWALGALLDLEGWGLSYASKTLMFMNPRDYVALDAWRIRASLGSVSRRFAMEIDAR